MRTGSFFVILLLAAVFAYANALNSDFIGDDLGRIVYETKLHHDINTALTQVMPDRPLLTASLWVNYQLGQLDPISYKIINILLHALVGFFLGLLALDLARADGRRRSWIWALVPALVFIVHPLNNQAVNSIAQRGAILSALFSLFALYLFARAEQKRLFLLLSFLCALLAILSKTNAFALPLILLAYAKVVRQQRWLEALRSVLPFFLIWLLPPFFYFILNISEQYGAVIWWQYLLTQLRVVFLYFKLFLAPTSLHFMYDISVSKSLWEYGAWLALLGHLSAFVSIGWLIKSKRYAAGFAWIAMYLSFLPESSVFAIRHLAFEHRAYLPLGFFLCGLSLLIPSRGIKGVYAASALVVAIFLGLNLTYNAKIQTYEKWSEYNLALNDQDMNFNVFTLNEFMDRQSPQGLRVAKHLENVFPNQRIFKFYSRMFNYNEQSEQQQRAFLQELYVFLTSEGLHFHRDARLRFNRFYGISIQKFLRGHEYWENVDDLLYAQLPELRKLGQYGASIFIIYKNNILRLLEHYRLTPSREDWRYARLLLSLKYNFGEKDPWINEQIEILAKSNSKIQNMTSMFETSELETLPLENGRID